MSRPILVDSSWYVHQARSGKDPLRELAAVADSREIAVCGMVVAEVGRGIRASRHLEAYRRCWQEMLWVEASREIWGNTLELAWGFDRQGLVLPIQDVHIAACAMEISAVLLTRDQHFQNFPELTVTDCLY